MPSRYERLVARQARAARTSKSDLVARYVIEKSLETEFPGMHAGQVLRAGESHGGLVLFRRTVRSTAYGDRARLLTDFWAHEGHAWDWVNRIIYLPKSP